MILYLACLLALLYLGLIGYLLIFWRPLALHSHCNSVHLPVSIVIVARDEATTISHTLRSISTNDYPQDLVEIILVDDQSTDDTVAIAKSLGIANLQIYSMEGMDIGKFGKAFKKAGQYHGIASSTHDIVLTTDADCICPPSWISTMIAGLDNGAMATGPVDIQAGDSILGLFQRYDNVGTMMTTSVGIDRQRWYSANAANMIFRKSDYHNYLSSTDVTHASGDDVIFLQWLAAEQEQVSFVNHPDAIVSTEGMSTWRRLYEQRVRWATKSYSYQHKGLTTLWIFIFLYNLSTLAAILCAPWCLMVASILVTAKIIGDTIMLKSGSRFFGYNYPLAVAPILSLVQLLYVLIIGVSSQLRKKYIWKGREVS